MSFTNSIEELERVKAYRQKAIDDGWVATATYQKEDIESATTLKKDGFTMSVIARDNSSKKYKHLYEAEISVWGDDGLAILPPKEYSFDAIVAAKRNCNACGAQDVKTMRYSFAGRCCAVCNADPDFQKKHHYDGWRN